MYQEILNKLDEPVQPVVYGIEGCVGLDRLFPNYHDQKH